MKVSPPKELKCNLLLGSRHIKKKLHRFCNFKKPPTYIEPKILLTLFEQTEKHTSTCKHSRRMKSQCILMKIRGGSEKPENGFGITEK